MFLTSEELKTLTSYANKSKQVAELRRMGIAFWVNAAGHPIVAKAFFEGGKATPPPKTWEPEWAKKKSSAD